MGNENYIDIKLKSRTSATIEIKIEKGCTFETKSKKFIADDDGKLSIFDKNTKTSIVSDTITITDYQKQAFEAIANNNDEKTGKLTLSIKDIKDALNMDKQKLGEDIGEIVAGNYKVQNPKIFPVENKLSAYISNGNEKTSGIVAFQHKDDDSVKIPNIDIKEAFLGSGLFTSTNVIEHKPLIHTVKAGEDINILAAKYNIDTFQIIAANPQLKAGIDYKITYPNGGLSEIVSQLEPGQSINIPARYSIKRGSMQSASDVAKATGVSEDYVRFLMVQEPLAANKPDLIAYDDLNPHKKMENGDEVKGTLTIGFGHTGNIYGEKIKIGTKITPQQAMDLLAEDIMKHKAMTVAYIGEKTYNKTPKSVQAAILDITYNKGIWDGFFDDRYCEQTNKVKKDLEAGKYAAALVHSRRVNTALTGLKTRNVYKFIMGLTDLPKKSRDAAMNAFEPYYQEIYSKLSKGDKPYLQKAWNNAKQGKTTNIRMRYGQ